MKSQIFDRNQKISWHPKLCLVFKCFVLGIVTDGAAVRVRGGPDETAQDHVSGGDREAGGCAEEPGSGREVGSMGEESLSCPFCSPSPC